jgi:hypothetical protein
MMMVTGVFVGVRVTVEVGVGVKVMITGGG